MKYLYLVFGLLIGCASALVALYTKEDEVNECKVPPSRALEGCELVSKQIEREIVRTENERDYCLIQLKVLKEHLGIQDNQKEREKENGP